MHTHMFYIWLAGCLRLRVGCWSSQVASRCRRANEWRRVEIMCWVQMRMRMHIYSGRCQPSTQFQRRRQRRQHVCVTRCVSVWMGSRHVVVFEIIIIMRYARIPYTIDWIAYVSSSSTAASLFLLHLLAVRVLPQPKENCACVSHCDVDVCVFHSADAADFCAPVQRHMSATTIDNVRSPLCVSVRACVCLPTAYILIRARAVVRK